MRKPGTVRAAEDFGRMRLSPNFFMRDFLHSEIAAINGFTNLPDDPDLAIEAGRGLCLHLLEPLQATFGRIAIRSAYRSPQVNAFGNEHFHNCGSNARNRARHIWDQRSEDGGIGAMATIVIPWLVDRIADDAQPTSPKAARAAFRPLSPKAGPASRATWVSMAWWIHDHLPYSELQFFPKLAAFNIAWHEFPKRRITSFTPPRGLLTKPGMANHEGSHGKAYPGFPKLRRR